MDSLFLLIEFLHLDGLLPLFHLFSLGLNDLNLVVLGGDHVWVLGPIISCRESTSCGGIRLYHLLDIVILLGC